jgi:glycosyltransferase involved in cell wall biosynthesis
MMTFSLIVPVYNAQPTLRRCLDSIVNQPFSDYELLLINDGSADESGDICREYAGRYPAIRYFEKENGGVSSARNLGLGEARGEYILFVDSDDFVSEDYFTSISDALKNKATDLLMFGYRNFGGISKECDTGEFYENAALGIAERVSSAMRQYLFSSLWSKVFKRQIIEQQNIRFANDLAIGEDFAFIFTYAMHIHSIASVSDKLYNVDISDGNSLSRKTRPYLTKQLMEVNRRMYAAYRAAEHSPEAARHYEEALSFMTYRSAYSCCKELLKFDISPKQRRREIRKICSLYRQEKVKPVGWKCAAIALPVRLGLSIIIDLLICCKTR